MQIRTTWIAVDCRRYRRVHRRAPSGRRVWVFRFRQDPILFRLPLSRTWPDAKAVAIAEAIRRGRHYVEVCP